MVDVNEKDEASKSISSPKEDGAPTILLEKTVVPGSTAGTEEPDKVTDEGNAMIGHKIDQVDMEEKTLTGVINNVQAVTEVTVGGKDEEKTKKHINGENLGGSSKGRKGKLRKGKQKKKVAQKAPVMLVGVANEGNGAAAAINEGLAINEKHDKEKAIREEATHAEDAVKEASIKGEGVEKTEEKQEEGKLGVSFNRRGRKPMRKRKKKVAQNASEMVVVNPNEGNATIVADNEGLTIDENHDKEKAMGKEATLNEDAGREASIKGEAEEKIEGEKKEEKLGEGSNRRGRKPKKNRKKKVAQKASEMVVVDGDKPESSNTKKASKKVKSMGMVFMCSSKTKADCFRYKVFGLPAGKKDQVEKIYKGMRLFLFDVDLRMMYGIFKAAGVGGYNIEPKAFKSAFPSQVRFTVMEDCLPLAEENFRNVIKENYYTRNKFECQLNAEQVKKLCKLFVAGPSPKKAIKNHRSGEDKSRRGREDAYTARGREKRKRWSREEEMQPRRPLGRERRRYHEYGEGQPPIRYEREALPVARYLPPPQQEAAAVRSYGYERAYAYAQDPVIEHRSYREPRHRDEMVSRGEREHGHLYGREAVTYRDDVYSSLGQTAEYHHHLPGAGAGAGGLASHSQYQLVSRDYPPPAADYHLSGGLQVAGYRDVGQHRSSGYRPRPPHYGY